MKEEKKEYRETKEKREEERKEVRSTKEKRDPTPSKKEEPVKEPGTPRKKERGLDDEEVGPAVS